MGDFKEDLKVGEQGEQVVINYLHTIDTIDFVEDVRNDALFQKHDIDFLVYNNNSLIIPIEVKSDTMAHRTGNLAYEVYSNKHYKTKGCLEKTKAKYVYYYLTKTKVLYVIDVNKLRIYVHENFSDGNLIAMGDFAEGYLIKLQNLEDRGIIKKLNWDDG